ncbi:MAG: hypothetical protein V4613_00670 [Bacteroidota bacterium]
MEKYTTISKLLCLVLLLNITFAQAQSYHTLLTTGYAYGTGKEGKAVENIFLKASLPLKLKNGNYLLVNTDVHRQSFYFDTVPSRTGYKTSLVVGYMKMKKDGSGSLVTILNFGNNFEQGAMGIESMQIGVGILAVKKKSPRLKVKYGLYVNKERFGYLIVPLFGVDYKINDNMRLFGVMPQNFKFEIKYNDKVRYGAMFDAPVNTYRVMGTTGWGYLDQRQVQVGLFGDIYFSKKLAMQVVVKQPIFNSHKIFSNNETYSMSILGIGVGGTRTGETVPQAYVKHGIMIECSLNYRLEIDK